MNVHKHMEVIFVVALAVAGLGSMAFDSMSEANASTSRTVLRDVAAAPAAGAVAVMCASKAPRRA
jgi:hypothetical protein